jgi:hypothetical protein
MPYTAHLCWVVRAFTQQLRQGFLPCAVEGDSFCYRAVNNVFSCVHSHSGLLWFLALIVSHSLIPPAVLGAMLALLCPALCSWLPAFCARL